MKTLDYLKRIDKKLDRLVKTEKILLKLEKKISAEEEEEISKQDAELDELKTLEQLERKIDQDVKTSPLTKITIKDFYKSMIGAFIGIIGHFSFFYGVEIAESISVGRATVLYAVSFTIGLFYVYFSGFRKVEDSDIYKFVPVRVFIIYFTSIAVIILTLYLFNFVGTESNITDIYKSVSTISILAVLGAATADLIGGKNE